MHQSNKNKTIDGINKQIKTIDGINKQIKTNKNNSQQSEESSK